MAVAFGGFWRVHAHRRASHLNRKGTVTHPAAENVGPITFTVVTGRDGSVVVTPRGELDIVSAPAVRERLLSLLGADATHLVVDMSAIRYADASGLAVLVSTTRRTVLLGDTLRLAALRPEVAGVLTAAGLGRDLAVYPSVQAAIAGRKRTIRAAHLAPSRVEGVYAVP